MIVIIDVMIFYINHQNVLVMEGLLGVFVPAMISLADGCGTWAIVVEIKAGLLLLKLACFVIGSVLPACGK